MSNNHQFSTSFNREQLVRFPRQLLFRLSLSTRLFHATPRS